ncbi:hypothetical protein PINS_up023018 [Pythium insidiosum]|nr:hypothetical protein PINS_up023018 [Pythium insidiosum]
MPLPSMMSSPGRRSDSNATAVDAESNTMVVSAESTMMARAGRIADSSRSLPPRERSQQRATTPNDDILGQDDREFDSAADHELESDEEGEDEGDEEEEEEEDDDDDDDDDDDGDAHSYYDSSDEAYFSRTMPQLTKRVKVSTDAKALDPSTTECFWAAFDGVVVPKTMIDLLNTTLTKLAHSRVVLLNKSSKHIMEDDARHRLKSVLERAEECCLTVQPPARPVGGSSGLSISRILNGSEPSSPTNTPEDVSPTASVGQKRKRSEDMTTTALNEMGFFAHFFSISELDMVWRSVMHAHLFNGRFGEIIEFHTAASGAFSPRDFDELMHIHTTAASSSSRSSSLMMSPLSGLKCCLVLPCKATDEEIFRVGKHLHSLLKLPGSLFFRSVDVSRLDAENNQQQSQSSVADLLNEDGNLTEESFRRFAQYRITKEETESSSEGHEKESVGVDHFLQFQRQRKVQHSLEVLTKRGWERRLAG